MDVLAAGRGGLPYRRRVQAGGWRSSRAVDRSSGSGHRAPGPGCGQARHAPDGGRLGPSGPGDARGGGTGTNGVRARTARRRAPRESAARRGRAAGRRHRRVRGRPPAVFAPEQPGRLPERDVPTPGGAVDHSCSGRSRAGCPRPRGHVRHGLRGLAGPTARSARPADGDSRSSSSWVSTTRSPTRLRSPAGVAGRTPTSWSCRGRRTTRSASTTARSACATPGSTSRRHPRRPTASPPCPLWPSRTEELPVAAPKLLLAFALAAIVTAAALSGCASSSSTGAVPTPATTSSAPSPSSPSDPATGGTLVGTWRTAALPTASWAATYRRVGGTATQAAAFVERIGGRIGSTETVTLRVGDKDWVQFGQADEDAPGQGSSGTYDAEGNDGDLHDERLRHRLHAAVRGPGHGRHVDRAGDQRRPPRCGRLQRPGRAAHPARAVRDGVVPAGAGLRGAGVGERADPVRTGRGLTPIACLSRSNSLILLTRRWYIG